MALDTSKSDLQTIGNYEQDSSAQERLNAWQTAINIADAFADQSPQVRDRARARGFRAALSVPMLRDGQPIGVIAVSRREAGAFAVDGRTRGASAAALA